MSRNPIEKSSVLSSRMAPRQTGRATRNRTVDHEDSDMGLSVLHLSPTPSREKRGIPKATISARRQPSNRQLRSSTHIPQSGQDSSQLVHDSSLAPTHAQTLSTQAESPFIPIHHTPVISTSTSTAALAAPLTATSVEHDPNMDIDIMGPNEDEGAGAQAAAEGAQRKAAGKGDSESDGVEDHDDTPVGIPATTPPLARATVVSPPHTATAATSTTTAGREGSNSVGDGGGSEDGMHTHPPSSLHRSASSASSSASSATSTSTTSSMASLVPSTTSSDAASDASSPHTSSSVLPTQQPLARSGAPAQTGSAVPSSLGLLARQGPPGLSGPDASAQSQPVYSEHTGQAVQSLRSQPQQPGSSAHPPPLPQPSSTSLPNTGVPAALGQPSSLATLPPPSGSGGVPASNDGPPLGPLPLTGQMPPAGVPGAPMVRYPRRPPPPNMRNRAQRLYRQMGAAEYVHGGDIANSAGHGNGVGTGNSTVNGNGAGVGVEVLSASAHPPSSFSTSAGEVDMDVGMKDQEYRENSGNSGNHVPNRDFGGNPNGVFSEDISLDKWGGKFGKIPDSEKSHFSQWSDVHTMLYRFNLMINELIQDQELHNNIMSLLSRMNETGAFIPVPETPVGLFSKISRCTLLDYLNKTGIGTGTGAGMGTSGGGGAPIPTGGMGIAVPSHIASAYTHTSSPLSSPTSSPPSTSFASVAARLSKLPGGLTSELEHLSEEQVEWFREDVDSTVLLPDSLEALCLTTPLLIPAPLPAASTQPRKPLLADITGYDTSSASNSTAIVATSAGDTVGASTSTEGDASVARHEASTVSSVGDGANATASSGTVTGVNEDLAKQVKSTLPDAGARTTRAEPAVTLEKPADTIETGVGDSVGSKQGEGMERLMQDEGMRDTMTLMSTDRPETASSEHLEMGAMMPQTGDVPQGNASSETPSAANTTTTAAAGGGGAGADGATAPATASSTSLLSTLLRENSSKFSSQTLFSGTSPPLISLEPPSELATIPLSEEIFPILSLPALTTIPSLAPSPAPNRTLTTITPTVSTIAPTKSTNPFLFALTTPSSSLSTGSQAPLPSTLPASLSAFSSLSSLSSLAPTPGAMPHTPIPSQMPTLTTTTATATPTATGMSSGTAAGAGAGTGAGAGVGIETRPSVNAAMSSTLFSSPPSFPNNSTTTTSTSTTTSATAAAAAAASTSAQAWRTLAAQLSGAPTASVFCIAQFDSHLATLAPALAEAVCRVAGNAHMCVARLLELAVHVRPLIAGEVAQLARLPVLSRAIAAARLLVVQEDKWRKLESEHQRRLRGERHGGEEERSLRLRERRSRRAEDNVSVMTDVESDDTTNGYLDDCLSLAMLSTVAVMLRACAHEHIEQCVGASGVDVDVSAVATESSARAASPLPLPLPAAAPLRSPVGSMGVGGRCVSMSAYGNAPAGSRAPGASAGIGTGLGMGMGVGAGKGGRGDLTSGWGAVLSPLPSPQHSPLNLPPPQAWPLPHLSQDNGNGSGGYGALPPMALAPSMSPGLAGNGNILSGNLPGMTIPSFSQSSSQEWNMGMSAQESENWNSQDMSGRIPSLTESQSAIPPLFRQESGSAFSGNVFPSGLLPGAISRQSSTGTTDYTMGQQPYGAGAGKFAYSSGIPYSGMADSNSQYDYSGYSGLAYEDMYPSTAPSTGRQAQTSAATAAADLLSPPKTRSSKRHRASRTASQSGSFPTMTPSVYQPYPGQQSAQAAQTQAQGQAGMASQGVYQQQLYGSGISLPGFPETSLPGPAIPAASPSSPSDADANVNMTARLAAARAMQVTEERKRRGHSTAGSRSLPPGALEILRGWLFAHFDQPYPTEDEKERLAQETGLTKSQVNYWMINARVRIWKPMLKAQQQQQQQLSQQRRK